MTYVSWAAFYEGPTDESYFDILLPRIMEDLVLCYGTRNVTIPDVAAVILGKIGRGVDEVANEACSENIAFHLVFIHADTGGRALEANIENRSTAYKLKMHELCNWPLERCIIIAPRHETEAWMLADPEAVKDSLGFKGNFAELGLPPDAVEAEKLVDPKMILATAMRKVRGQRRSIHVQQLIPAIAQRQSFDCLRRSISFVAFENELADALESIGCIARQ
jgi:Domain of unknown function (DUF4276)